MKTRLFIAALALVLSASYSAADDRPVDFSVLPAAARNFITDNFAGAKVSYAAVDDDFIRPDYKVMLSDGTTVQFDNDGRLEKVESSRNGIPSDIIPVQIREYVKRHYPDAYFLEYEIGRRSYEVTLSNRLELKFSSNFNILEIDD